ncbi:MAG: hypothetical protein QOE86_2691, partial [Solirubrobacteraceae bacterium]|nr:hypothetical protein [Solirubrobacteraceae bacterium]
MLVGIRRQEIEPRQVCSQLCGLQYLDDTQCRAGQAEESTGELVLAVRTLHHDLVVDEPREM